MHMFILQTVIERLLCARHQGKKKKKKMRKTKLFLVKEMEKQIATTQLSKGWAKSKQSDLGGSPSAD